MRTLWLSGAALWAGWSAIAPAQTVPAVCVELSKHPEDDALRQKCIDVSKRLAAARAEVARLEAEVDPAAAAPPPPAPAPVVVAAAGVGTPAAANGDPNENDGAAKNKTEPNSLGGIKFGVGLGATFDVGKHDRVKAASVVNGLVRISESDNQNARLLLESHYFFTPPGKLLGLATGDWGVGPFIAVQGGPDEVIQGIGGGIMFGLKRLRANDASEGRALNKAAAAADASSFNIGLGFFWDLHVQTLGDGIFKDQPLPTGETDIRFRNRSQGGVLLMSSFAF